MKKKLLISTIAVVFMVCYTFIVYNIMFSPEKMFSKAIDKTVNKINQNIENTNFQNVLTDINVKFNTDSSNLKSFSDYTYGIKFGTDTKNKAAETKVYMIDKNNKEYSYTGYIKNSNLYHKLSSLDKLILYNIENQDLTKTFETTNDINTKDIKYLINKSSKSIIKNFDKKKFSKEKTNIKVNNKDLKVTKNTYEIDSKEANRLYKAVYNDLYNDSKALEILISLTGKTKEEIKSEMNQTNNETINETIKFNVYNKFNKILGFDIDQNNEKIISYYKNGDEFNIDYSFYKITGVKQNKNLEVKVKSNEDVLATMVFSKYKKDDFAFDYITEAYVGKVEYKRIKNKNTYKVKLNISLNDGKNNYSFDINANQDLNSKIADIDTNNAEKYTEEQFAEALINFTSSLKGTPLEFVGTLFTPSYDEVDYSNYSY